MKEIQKNKMNILKILLGLLSLSMAIIFSVVLSVNQKLELDTTGLSQIEQLSSIVQRVSKLELENSPDEDLIELGNYIIGQFALENPMNQYFQEEIELQSMIEQIVFNWKFFKEKIYEYRDHGQREDLFLASEENYSYSAEVVKHINTYLNHFSEAVAHAQKFLMINLFLFTFTLLLVICKTMQELKKNKELSKDMFIDLSTGIYNGAKCQAVLKNEVTPKNAKERAIVIFDLNDLKKTNDTLGHRAGDQLIATFAEQLKKATEIFDFEIFVGRYGGDEFMIYFESAREKDVKRYIEQVNHLLTEINESGQYPFRLAGAAGYSITTQETNSLTLRELFEQADSDMYQNKIAMKEKRRQELLAQGIKEVVVADDRL